MDPENSFQEVVRCHLCETPDPPLHCDICHIHLCKDCEKKHLTDGSNEHKVVPFKFRGCIIKCQKHSSKICERFCEQCSIPVCKQCASSVEHRGHKFIDVVKKLESQKEILQSDLKELENYIHPKYNECASIIKVQKSNLCENSQKLTIAIDKSGDDMHREIDNAINKFKSDLNEMNSKSMAVLSKQEDEIKRALSEITKSIADMNELLISNDVSLVSAFTSKNAEFRKFPPKLTVVLPGFIPHKITEQHIYKQLIGSMSAPFIKTEEQSYTMDTPEAESSLQGRQLIDDPPTITSININTENEGLFKVSCLTEDQVWTCGFTENIMRLYNLQGELVKAFQPISGNGPWNIAVTRSGDLLYTDYTGGTVNIVKDTEKETVVRIHGWRPHGVCVTISDDLLIAMTSDNNEQTKVVRYSNFKAKQSIQFDDEGKPLFSTGMYNFKFISENRNLDICVSDNIARAVLVVNQAGKLRFTYHGYGNRSYSGKKNFEPCDITTDSQSRILIADIFNNCIHILNEDGKFLRFFEYNNLKSPCGLCVDTKDNIYVAEIRSGKLTKIQNTFYN